MPEKIDYHAMNDHDLLVQAVWQGNETVHHLELINGTQKNHERRLTVIETHDFKPISMTKKQAVGVGGSAIIIGGFITGVIQALGSMAGWW